MAINQFNLPPGMELEIEAAPSSFTDRDLLAIFAAAALAQHRPVQDFEMREVAERCFNTADHMISELNRRTQ
jgi:hypothetical protein